MLKIDSTITTLVIAGAVAFGISYLVSVAPERNAPAPRETGAPVTAGITTQAIAPAPRQPWAASATGRVEPKDGEIRLASQIPGRIVEVPVDKSDRVSADETLVRLDDEEAKLKVAAAEAEAAVRRRERDEENVRGVALERRKAEDLVADDERAVFRARQGLDLALSKQRSGEGSAPWEVSDRDEFADPANAADRRAALQMLDKALNSLSKRDKTIVQLRYGRSMPFHEIGQRMNLSESRVCQLHKRILGSLRGYLKRDTEMAA